MGVDRRHVVGVGSGWIRICPAIVRLQSRDVVPRPVTVDPVEFELHTVIYLDKGPYPMPRYLVSTKADSPGGAVVIDFMLCAGVPATGRLMLRPRGTRSSEQGTRPRVAYRRDAATMSPPSNTGQPARGRLAARWYRHRRPLPAQQKLIPGLLDRAGPRVGRRPLGH